MRSLHTNFLRFNDISYPHLSSLTSVILNTGGFRANLTQLPDWVDYSVAEWIASETKAMEDAWGPADRRAALAFVHIPPYVYTGPLSVIYSNDI